MAENSAAVAPIAPIKTGIAFFVSGLLQGIEPPDVVDHDSDALRELPHRFKGQIVQPWPQRQAGGASPYRRERHSVEDIVECFKLESTSDSLGDDTNPGATKNRL
jgi:hypothetical protein